MLLGNKTGHYRDIYLLILLKWMSDHVVLVAAHAIEYATANVNRNDKKTEKSHRIRLKHKF